MRPHRFEPGLLGGLLVAALFAGCDAAHSPSSPSATSAAPVAVSSSYLEAALRAVLPADVPLVRLAGPAMCPGHFDVRPSQISDLAKCRLLIRFDFQQTLDGRLGSASLPVLGVSVPGGMCEPQSFTAACRQIADHFVSAGELDRAEADRRLAQVAQRAAALTKAAAEKIDAAGLRDTPVLASHHQAAFCRWLGLRVVGIFSGADTAGTGEIDQAVTAGEAAKVRLIIANEPEGRRLADALGDRLRATVIVLANFPEPGQDAAFDALVERNLAALLAAAPAAAKPT